MKLEIPKKYGAHLRVGTCSWKYDSWKGLLYDDGTNYHRDDYLVDYSKHLGTVEVGQFVPVRVKDEKPDAVRTLPPPTTKPTVDAVFRRESNFYKEFSWEAYARRVDETSHYAELTVVVRWIEAGRNRSVTLTSAVPRSVLEGAA